MSTRNSQPIYAHALICESVRTEQTTPVIAAIANNYTVRALEGALNLPNRQISFVILVNFYSDEPKDFQAGIRILSPTGMALMASSQPTACRTEGGAQGYTLKMRSFLTPEEAGDYWIEVYVDGVVTTKVPLHVAYEKKEPTRHATT